MPINFFDDDCKTESSRDKFGLCDNPPPATDPAYIEEHDPFYWIGIVNNPTNKKIAFYAIDNCVPIFKIDGVSLASRCDGILRYDNTIIFIELKARGGSGWLSGAREQLVATVDKFQEENSLAEFEKVEAYACNALRPAANQGNSSELQKFKDETGLIMYSQQKIDV